MSTNPLENLRGKPVSRRTVLRAGTLAAAGMLLGRRLGFGAEATAPAAPPKAKAVIQIWMWGGPSHLDTFDPKPDMGNDYCGPFNKPIKTSADGMVICELLPELAKQAGKYSLIRGMTHEYTAHETASYMVQTSHLSGERRVYPSIGAVTSLFEGYDAGYRGLVPPYIVLTESPGRFSESGFLGPRYAPFVTGGDPARQPFAVQGIVAEGIPAARQQQRRELLHDLDSLDHAMGADPHIGEFNAGERDAYDMILGKGAEIFDLAKEDNGTRDWYGRTTFGQSCLAARRLIENGVRFVTINNNGWDTHKQNFQVLRRKLPEFDKGVSALLQDLASRGLLDSTIVWCGGEFGRTPKIMWEEPWNGGRGHWCKAFSMLLAGGGFRGGQVVGVTDAKGEEVKERPVSPADLLGSMYQLLGIDPAAPFPRQGDDSVRITEASSEAGKSGGLLKEIM
ncbi:MAG TPA: DUF1501 domain-containing protein [Chthoniobacteraceae bacterium]|nr:DUF1501 domain-containing protein [Chthoniobacteraceae bacterium]